MAHPWNPPHLVPFVEVLRSQCTADDALDALVAVLESVGRKPAVMKKNAPGFIANRLQHALYREAVYMVEQGISTPRDIDMALKYSFMPRYTSIGLFEHFDYAGLDMIVSIEDYLFPTLCNDRKTQDLVRSKYDAGKLGYKTGRRRARLVGRGYRCVQEACLRAVPAVLQLESAGRVNSSVN